MNTQEIIKQDYEEQSRKIKNLIDFLVMETLRLDRMLLDQKCIEAIAIEPEILKVKDELLELIGNNQ